MIDEEHTQHIVSFDICDFFTRHEEGTLEEIAEHLSKKKHTEIPNRDYLLKSISKLLSKEKIVYNPNTKKYSSPNQKS